MLMRTLFIFRSSGFTGLNTLGEPGNIVTNALRQLGLSNQTAAGSEQAPTAQFHPVRCANFYSPILLRRRHECRKAARRLPIKPEDSPAARVESAATLDTAPTCRAVEMTGIVFDQIVTGGTAGFSTTISSAITASVCSRCDLGRKRRLCDANL
jgi:hypothetical protein